jgi:perosamine synthetase
MKKKIALYEPSLGKYEKKFVNDCLSTNWISSKGKYIKLFEKSFKNFTKIKNCITVTNGTCGLHLALRGLEIAQGDEVLVPSFTYIASVNCIRYVNAKPIFVDIDLDNWQINIDKIERKITKKTKAILIPHLYGNVCNLDFLLKIKKKYKLFLIEDCAESIGSFFDNKHVGNFGDVSVFSFFGSKTITTGEGGMVCTNKNVLAKKIIKLKGQGLQSSKSRKYYWHDVIGYNYRMTNICAAVGFAQMKNIKQILKKKNHIYKFYKKNLTSSKIVFPKIHKKVINSHWLVVFRLKKRKLRNKLISYLNKNNIETRPSFYLIHEMKMYKKNLNLINSNEVSNNGICLPSYPNLSKNQLVYVVNKIRNFLKENG